jgi:hypothetical protein
VIFYILNIEHNNKIALCWLEDLLLMSGGDLLRVRRSLCGQCRFSVMAMACKR